MLDVSDEPDVTLALFLDDVRRFCLQVGDTPDWYEKRIDKDSAAALVRDIDHLVGVLNGGAESGS